MLLVGLKRCAFYTPIRQLAILHRHGRIRINEKSIHFPGFKYTNLSNLNSSVQRLYSSTNPEKEPEKCRLPPLTWQYPKDVIIPFLNLYISYFIIRGSIDRSFRLIDFLLGVKQAMLVISHALASQNYEAINGMVKDCTLKLLKHRVDRLRPDQRKLIAIDSDMFFFAPGTTAIRRRKDLNEIIFEVEVMGIYVSEYYEATGNIIGSSIKDSMKDILYCTYKFQRKYTDGIGGSWIVNRVNHFS